MKKLSQKEYDHIIDNFLQKTICDHCHAPLNETKIMSVFNTDRICKACWEKEKQRPDYAKAMSAQCAAETRGEFSFQGIDVD